MWKLINVKKNVNPKRTHIWIGFPTSIMMIKCQTLSFWCLSCQVSECHLDFCHVKCQTLSSGFLSCIKCQTSSCWFLSCIFFSAFKKFMSYKTEISNLFSFITPVSTTNTTSLIVTDVSAILVARTIFLIPRAVGLKNIKTIHCRTSSY